MNKPLQQQLWENIRTFAIDDPQSAFPFSKKLAKENNWSNSFTAAAIEEYRKFIFLCCILPGGASPSDIVDKVWHLHLTYTNNYWIEFCEKTLHQKIHHHPSQGGNEEHSKHADWYQQTLNQYTEIFGTTPPSSVWPASVHQQKIFEIYDANYSLKVILLFTALVILIVVAGNIFHSRGIDFLSYYGIILVAGLFCIWRLMEHKSDRLQHYIDINYPKDFTNYQVSFFLNGQHRAYQTALVELLKKDIIEVAGSDYKFNGLGNNFSLPETNPMLEKLSEKMEINDLFTYSEGLGYLSVEKVHHPVFDEFKRVSKIIDYQKFIIPGTVIIIGAARILQGLVNEKPVSFLMFEMGSFALLALIISAQNSFTELVFKMVKQKWMNQNNYGQSSDVLNNFTILGVAAIAGFSEYPVLKKVFDYYTPAKAYASGGGSGGACSSSCGSSCGSGCGGCGGGD